MVMTPATTDNTAAALVAQLLDNQADTQGLANISATGGDWTDVKHSERKKRDRILDDGVLIKLMQKSDYQGFKRLFINLSIMGLTAYGLKQLQVFPINLEEMTVQKVLMFVPLYLFYGFQFQCFAFAGVHEFLHRNAFKSKWINDMCLFVTSLVCFEFGKHERVMHKQHHTFTNDIDNDPELTSFYPREVLESPGFRNVAVTRAAYLHQFLDIYGNFKRRMMRILNSARGIPVDYSGTGWSMSKWTFHDDSGILLDLQWSARFQILCYMVIFGVFGQNRDVFHSFLFWWIVPVLIGYPFVNFFRNLEHADCEISKDFNSLRNTRSVRSNLFIRLLLWDTNFHAEHHCYPMVPFFNLHKINKIMHDHCLHNSSHFTTQNWDCVKQGGWIDQQHEANAQVKIR